MWHDFDIKWNMKPCFWWVQQKVLCLTGINICISMNMICKSRFLTSIGQECGSKWFIEHFLHHPACLLPFLIKLSQKQLACFSPLTISYSRMQFTKQFLYYMKFCLCQWASKQTFLIQDAIYHVYKNFLTLVSQQPKFNSHCRFFKSRMS